MEKFLAPSELVKRPATVPSAIPGNRPPPTAQEYAGEEPPMPVGAVHVEPPSVVKSAPAAVASRTVVGISGAMQTSRTSSPREPLGNESRSKVSPWSTDRKSP